MWYFYHLLKNFFRLKMILCHLLIVAVIKTTKTLLLKIFINIIRVPIISLVLLETVLTAFGILICPVSIPLWLINIQALFPLQELTPACYVLICFLLNSTFLLSLNELLILNSIHFLLFSVALSLMTLQALVLFTIFWSVMGFRRQSYVAPYPSSKKIKLKTSAKGKKAQSCWKKYFSILLMTPCFIINTLNVLVSFCSLIWMAMAENLLFIKMLLRLIHMGFLFALVVIACYVTVPKLQKDA